MNRQHRLALALVPLALASLLGCAHSPVSDGRWLHRERPAPRDADATRAAGKPDTSPFASGDDLADPADRLAADDRRQADRRSLGSMPPESPGMQAENRDEQLAAIRRQLEAQEGLDDTVKEQILADLARTDPSQREDMLRIFRWALSARQATPPPSSPSSDADGTVQQETARQSLPAADRSYRLVANGAQAKQARVGESHSETDITPRLSKTGHPAESPRSAEQARVLPPIPTETAAGPRAERIRPVSAAPPGDSSKSVRFIGYEAAKTENPPPLASTVSTPGLQSSRDASRLTWDEHLRRAIGALSDEVPDSSRSGDELRRHVRLRLLQLVEGDPEQALKAIAGIPPTQQEFWSAQLYALSTLLDEGFSADVRDRAAEARKHLISAAAELSELSVLELRNMAFCSEVNSYGVHTRFEQYEFTPGQQLLLYVEVDNFRSEQSEQGYKTTLRSSYAIHDARGNRVAEHDFSSTEDVCQNRRRDFFMRYLVELPERIYPGRHTLTLTIEDVRSQEFAEAKLEFEVVESP